MFSTKPYPESVSSLLTLGETDWQEWGDYQALGFSHEHISDLIRMATDPRLIIEAEEPEFWAPIHAWRALAQLEAKEAIEPLVGNFNFFEAADSDWLSNDLPRALVKLGADCIPALAMYLIDTRHESMSRIGVSETLKDIAVQYPDAHEQVKGILLSALELFEENDEELNGFLLGDLLDLKAVEAIPVIRRAFSANAIDITIAGDLEEAELELGLREQRETASRVKEALDLKYPALKALREKIEQKDQREKQHAQKAKAKRKQQKKARKRNQRK